jgi:hypothetical protein
VSVEGWGEEGRLNKHVQRDILLAALGAGTHDDSPQLTVIAVFEALDAFGARVESHHEFPRDAESPESYSAILTKNISVPIQIFSRSPSGIRLWARSAASKAKLVEYFAVKRLVKFFHYCRFRTSSLRAIDCIFF